MAFLLLQTGDRLTLQTGTGSLLLQAEGGPAPIVGLGLMYGPNARFSKKARRKWEEDDEEVMRLVTEFLSRINEEDDT